MTPDELITKKDLENFKKELFELLGPLAGGKAGNDKWLKNEDLKKLLKISGATIQNLRVNGALPFSKIGGIYFYKQEDIDKMLEGPEKKRPLKRPAARKNKLSASTSS
ncbi:helix-turn-helix domain-containing protein [Mucilaginibacter sp. HC2]|uniref:helix-turn-helix domain-containing protein n=1 Tax=Mucilaginibacter inviolabilis TaxID=2714892 RepID=UPI00140C27E9|nr:helix-turn-helix domain-containing protein [Mucilaginibacter inviolabilis]NHA03464.1 helix-turn-helix domain-containing protein [Mucilaginibacter inviolabilis]